MPNTQKTPEKIVIASRESRLALWQAEHVKTLLQTLYPHCEVSIFGMTTRGDQILDRTLSKVGGKGLFVKELEVALLEGHADLAVHSLKDVPMQLEPEFCLAAILEREDPRDALVSNHYANLDALPAGAVVGTSSLRREAQLRARWPHIQIQPLRGNLDTRLAKLEREEYQAIVLAAAGLKRLGLAERIRQILSPTELLPSAGQGALAIEILQQRTELSAWLAPLHHNDTASAVLAERAVSRALGGNCSVPLAAYATVNAGQMLELRACVGKPDGSLLLKAQGIATSVAAETLGQQVAEQLRAQGAQEILERLCSP